MANYSLTPRVKMLAEKLLEKNSSINSERATILASIGEDIAGMPPLVKKAQHFSQLMSDLPLYIGQDELIIGSQSSALRGAIFHTEEELNSPSVFGFLNSDSTQTPDYMTVISTGLKVLEQHMESRLKNIGSAISRNGMDEVNQGKAMLLACKGAETLTQRLAAELEAKASAESHPYRKAELQEAAATLRHILGQPARTFKEACQAFYLIQLMMHLDNGGYAVGHIGFDKALYGYYQRDINAGVITAEQAYEIVESLWLKLVELSEVLL